MKNFSKFYQCFGKICIPEVTSNPPLTFFEKYTKSLVVFYISLREWRLFPNFIKLLKKLAFPRANVKPPSNFFQKIYKIAWMCFILGGGKWKYPLVSTILSYSKFDQIGKIEEFFQNFSWKMHVFGSDSGAKTSSKIPK